MTIEIVDIDYLGSPECENTDTGWVDLSVTIKDESWPEGYTYCLTVTTLKSLVIGMEQEKKKFVIPELPCILVTELRQEIIEAAVKEFIYDAPEMYWIKLYHVASFLSIENLNKLLQEQKKEEEENRLDSIPLDMDEDD